MRLDFWHIYLKKNSKTFDLNTFLILCRELKRGEQKTGPSAFQGIWPKIILSISYNLVKQAGEWGYDAFPL